MINIVLPDNRQRRLPFYLALEEWVAKNLDARDYIFTWVVAPTVICGRNQDIEKEVDLDYCRAHGIDVVRRRSGGGCVYADSNNIMISFITPDTDIETTFAYFSDRVAQQLCNIGISAEATGRNDIIVAGRKISGSAFHRLPSRSIVHCTMLYDTDSEAMSHAITPSRAKTESKRVQSVQSRIVTAKELMPDLQFNDFHCRILEGLVFDSYQIVPDQLAQVEALERDYYNPKWLWRKQHIINAEGEYLPNVGEICLQVSLDKNNTIADVDVNGDFFDNSEKLESLLESLKGHTPDKSTLQQILLHTDVSEIITGLTTEQFINLITDKNNQYGRTN